MSKLEIALSAAPFILWAVGTLGRVMSAAENDRVHRMGEVLLALGPDLVRFVAILRGAPVELPRKPEAKP